MMKIAFALSLLVACGKSDSSPNAQAPASPDPAAPAEQAAPAAPPGPAAPQARPTPRLPDQKPGDDGPRWGGRRGDRPNIDTDGDGKVSDEERAVARKQRLDGMRSHLDANGDGKLTVDELKATEGGGGRRRMRFDDPAALDTNHDGDISADELGAAMEARREQWRQRRDGGGSGSDATP